MFLKSNLFKAKDLTKPQTVIKIGKYKVTVIRESKDYLKFKIETKEDLFYVDVFDGGSRLDSNKRELIEENLEIFIFLEALNYLEINFENVKNKNKLYDVVLNNYERIENYKERILDTVEVEDLILNQDLQKILTLDE